MLNISEQLYKEAMEATALFNNRLLVERKMRMPFIDNHTGVAQKDCNLWHSYSDRQPGVKHGQLYTYPSRRWRKQKRVAPVEIPQPIKVSTLEAGESDVHEISNVENPSLAKLVEEDKKDNKSDTNSQDKWYDDYEDISEPPDAGEIEDPSDGSDYEETYRKKRKKTTTTGAKRGRKPKSEQKALAEAEELDKPFSCEICGARYKTRPGLTYHLTHFHNSMLSEDSPLPSPRPSSQGADTEATPTKSTAERGPNGRAAPNNYCDFCLGDSSYNKKTKSTEYLVSCADCGRSGHPTCLQFTDNMIISVKNYPWQCIECKSCGLCGTSENDEQLLFCDDCDRGFHMYCLNPPLSEAPEGSWSCHLCIAEFHEGKKPQGMH